ncbi:prephenate dehydrogenase [Campylobacter sp. MIT 12-8780]|uniref:prephenate dehydrogenase n=1 Tax=unclassified Campylobacter TaxID=2593542 RepID=UPI0010F9D35E|nr:MULTISPECIES: prephenate dehydrogenase [unclassified Campylobacter]NDJ27320.1 prephenate dehydrogenase [Campylobacter sp. MIT 19-121]TKX28428.1 prephenate dehydrogenase [Campylobacter sp. MIT 12-5580]TQR40353.1 prephenate dehydrogenase [Campylobacter sp. MIT 12-8780]
MKIGIIGLGLMGGSLGLCLRENKLISKVLGYDTDEKNAKEALNLGLVDELASFKEIKTCDIIILAIPVDAIVKVLKELKDTSSNTTIIELGSTKKEIIKSLPKELKSHFIAAHPMAGTENSGAKAAFKELYKNAVCVLCESEAAEVKHRQRAVELFSYLGMQIIFMNASAHDHHTAIISHLPHAISFALANFVMKEENKKNIVHLGGPSFKGMSRIAKSSPAMWGSIFEQNKENLLASIELFQNELELCKKMIQDDDEKALKKWMKKANALRDIL